VQRVQRSKILTGLNICLDTLKVSKKVTGVEYAIRDIVLAARKVEQTGMKVDYLNIGDPVQFGFQPPDNVKQALIDARDWYVALGWEEKKAIVKMDSVQGTITEIKEI